jgi:hypothetical protein
MEEMDPPPSRVKQPVTFSSLRKGDLYAAGREWWMVVDVSPSRKTHTTYELLRWGGREEPTTIRIQVPPDTEFVLGSQGRRVSRVREGG